MEIPLPPLEEQRRIVGRIEELAGKIAEARGLRDRSIRECDDLSRSILFHCKSQSKITQMSDLVYLRKPDVSMSPDRKQKAQAGNKIRYESLEELDALLPAILDKAFKGEL